jgi:UDP-glucuronate 4-epimerase
MKYLVTGAAGFIGSNVVKTLLAGGHEVVGVDNINDYYDPKLKHDRLAWIGDFPFEQIDISDETALIAMFKQHQPNVVIHLAAQAGVRYSIENPHAYIQSNIIGFQNILECSRVHKIEHLVYASSSSVYGNNKKIPFSTTDEVDHPVSTYAATKKSNELMAHVYSHLYDLPTTGLRFFTVYGPWGRPDMSPFIFADAIFSGKELKLFSHGHHKRDFTYIDDIVAGVINVAGHIPGPCVESGALYKIYNIGNNNPVELIDYVNILEEIIGKPANKVLVGPQPGDVATTFADIDDLKASIGYAPSTDLKDGLTRFVDWYRDYYRLD